MKKILLSVVLLISARTLILAQTAPKISYGDAKTFTVGTAIKSLAPTNTGGKVPNTAYGTPSVFVGSGSQGSDNGVASKATFYGPCGIATDKSGNFYVTDARNNLLRKITAEGKVSTVSLSPSLAGPCGIVVDSKGNIFIADQYNNVIKKVTPAGVVSVFAGSGYGGRENGKGTAASFYYPYGLAIDSKGNIFVADEYNSLIRKITPTGVVSTVAGSNYAGNSDGTGTSASFYNPTGVAVDAAGNLFIADNGNNRIRKITTDGKVTTVAGSGYSAFADGIGTAASFNQPSGITLDAIGNIYISDQFNEKIRKVTPDGVVSTLVSYAQPNVYLSTRPGSLMYSNGKLYVTCYSGNQIRAIALTGYSIDKDLPEGLAINLQNGVISGTPQINSAATNYKITAINGYGISTATLNITVAIAKIAPVVKSFSPTLSFAGSSIVITGSNLLGATSVSIGGKKASDFTISSPTLITATVPTGAVAGSVSVTNPYGTSTLSGFKVYATPAISYKTPQSYTTGKAITKLSPVNTGGEISPGLYQQVSSYAGNGQFGNVTGSAANASFGTLSKSTSDALGNLYIVDNYYHVIKKITPAGEVTNFAGAGYNGNINGQGTAAAFSTMNGIAADAAGNIIVADQGNNEIRKITPAGLVTTIAGNGTWGYTNGKGADATFNQPSDVAIDASGNIFVADRGNTLIRKITPGGVVSTFAGSGSSGFINGTGISASFSYPNSICIDKKQNLYVADLYNAAVRKITPAGVVTTFLSSPTDLLGNISDIKSDASSNLVVAVYNYAIYKTNTKGTPVLLAGASGASGNIDGVGSGARFGEIDGISISNSGDIFVCDYQSHKVRKIAMSGYSITPDLPNGLILDENGAISGTPVEVTPAKNYIIEGINPAGISTATINIKTVIPAVPPTITSLSAKTTAYGKTVIITGKNFLGATSVKLGSTSLRFGILSPTNIAVVISSHTTGDLMVTNPYGSAKASLTISGGPAISYKTPQNLLVGTEASVSPTNAGTAIPKGAYGATTKYAGSYSSQGVDNGDVMLATFSTPRGTAIDQNGNMYVADMGNNLIRKITADGTVSTFAGSGYGSFADGVGIAASFNHPMGVAVDLAGNVYVADFYNHRVRKITPDGTVTTLAGNGQQGTINGTGTAATLEYPWGIAVDLNGNIFVSENYYANDIRKITPAGVVTTFAGKVLGHADGKGTAASFNAPTGLTFDIAGNLYVADAGNNMIRKITPAGVVTTVTGKATAGYTDGALSVATFRSPNSVAVDCTGNIYVADTYNELIRVITPDGHVNTVAGNGGYNNTDGLGALASFNTPTSVFSDDKGGLYVTADNSIRRVNITGYSISTPLPADLAFDDATGKISGKPANISAVKSYTITGINTYGISAAKIDVSIKIPTEPPVVKSFSPTSTGPTGIVTITGSNFIAAKSVTIGGVAAAAFNVISPTTITASLGKGAASGSVKVTNAYGTGSASGFTLLQPPNLSYSGSQTYQTNKAITPLNIINKGTSIPKSLLFQTATVAGSGQYGSLDGSAASATFANPRGIAKDAKGNIYVIDQTYNSIRKITAAGDVSVFAVNQNGGPYISPIGITADAFGNLLVANNYNVILKIKPDGTVSTFAGNGSAAKNDGTALSAGFNYPVAVAADVMGNVYVADANNYEVRKITAAGMVTTLAGNGTQGSLNGTGKAAQFNMLTGITVDRLGNVYVSETTNTIRKITPSGVVTTFAGNGVAGYKDGTGTGASFNNPAGLTTDAPGNIYVADYNNNRIRKITPAGVVTTIGGNETAGLVNDVGNEAQFGGPSSVVADAAGVLDIADRGNNVIRKISLTGYTVSPDLPEGLTINGSGTISGKPAKPSPATNYTVTGYNTVGTSNATVSIKVVIPAVPPNITSFTPKSGVSGSGIIITGTNLLGATKVTIGGADAASFTAVSATTIQAIISSKASSGDVVVTNPYGKDSMSGFVFNKPPDISYSTGLTFTAGNPITPLKPKNTGSVIPANVYGSVKALAGLTGDGIDFDDANGITIDASGNIYIADSDHQTIKKITPAGVLSTIAGSYYYSGYLDGTGNVARFYQPSGMVSDAKGNIYIADRQNNRIRKMTTKGEVTTFAGGGSNSSTDGTGFSVGFNYPTDLAIDGAGNLYVSEASNRIRKITPSGTVTTLAGSTYGYKEGTGQEASFASPAGLAVDALGNIYVADKYNNRIRKITPEGIVSTFAGNGTMATINGTGTNASFYNPDALTIDAGGNIYVSEYKYIRKIDTKGNVTTIAGNGANISYNTPVTDDSFSTPTGLDIDKDGNLIALNIQGNALRKVAITGYTIDRSLPEGLIFDPSTGIISGTPVHTSTATLSYNITGYNAYGSSTAKVSFTAGFPKAPAISYAKSKTYTAGITGEPIKPNSSGGGIPPLGYIKTSTLAYNIQTTDDYNESINTLKSPAGIALDAGGNVYVSIQDNRTIGKIASDKTFIRFAGNTTYGYADGPAGSAEFTTPTGLVINSKVELIIADGNSEAIRKIANGKVSTIAGAGFGYADGKGNKATFYTPYGIAIDGKDNLYVTETGNNLIRKITPDGVVTTMAGNRKTGKTNGTGKTASFNSPKGIAVDTKGNLYIADEGNNLIRKITSGGAVTTFAGSGKAASTDGKGVVASFNKPTGLTIDNAGNLYCTDFGSNLIRKITADGVVTTLAGDGKATSLDGNGKQAGFNQPIAIAASADGSELVVCDYGGNTVRRIDLLGYSINKELPDGLVFDNATGIISGTATKASATTDYTITAVNAKGTATAVVKLNVLPAVAPSISYTTPQKLTVGKAIKTITPVNKGGEVPAVKYGEMTTFAGSGSSSSVNGTGIAASFYTPAGILFDKNGNLFVTESGGNLIRKVTQAGVVSTFAGSGGSYNYTSTDGIGTTARFANPTDITQDEAGNFYVVDQNSNKIRVISPAAEVKTMTLTGVATGNISSYLGQPVAIVYDKTNKCLYVSDYDYNVIRKVTLSGAMSVYAGTGSQGAVDGSAKAATFSYPRGLALDDKGNLYVADEGNSKIRKITPKGVVSTFAGSNQYGLTDGKGTSATFSDPMGLTIDANNNIYVADRGNNAIRKITPSGVVSTVIKSTGNYDVQSTLAPFSLAISNNGKLYISDAYNVIRAVDLNGYQIDKPLPAGLNFDGTTGAISGVPTMPSSAQKFTVTAHNYGGDDDAAIELSVSAGAPPDISYKSPGMIAKGKTITPIVPANNGGVIYATDSYGQTSTISANSGYGNYTGAISTVWFNQPKGIVKDANGNLYVAESGSVKKITSGGMVSYFAGSYFNGFTNGTTDAARFWGLNGITFSKDDDLIVVDSYNYAIRKIADGNVTTLAGNGEFGYANGTGNAALFGGIIGIVSDGSGNLYLTEPGYNDIRKITPAGVVTTFAGSTTAGFVNGTGTAAKFSGPTGIAIDAKGNLYVADKNNYLIRKITPAGVVSTFAGNGKYGVTDGKITDASFSAPNELTFDISGNLFVSDNSLIRMINANGIVTTVAGNTLNNYATPADGLGTAAVLYYPNKMVVNNDGNLYFDQSNYGTIRKISLLGYTVTPALPLGLQMDSKTGIISGKPTANTPAKDYTITGYNAAGSSSTTISLGVADKTGAIISFKDQQLTYGDADVAIAATSTNDKESITYTSGDTKVVTIVKNKLHIVAAGEVVITASQAASGDNTATTAKHTLKISKAPLTVTADNQTKKAGAANPALTATITGFVNGEDKTDLKTQPKLITTATTSSKAGTYPITASGAAADNYAFTYVAGKLTVSASAAQITQAAEVSKQDNVALIPPPAVPSALSPNGDGLNDVLIISNITNYPDNKFTLIDKNGAGIYEVSGYDNNNRIFDGHAGAAHALLKPGTYYYLLDYKDKTGSKQLTGYIIIKY